MPTDTSVIGKVLMVPPAVRCMDSDFKLATHLASRLAVAGYQVMRFDFQGLGDSEGQPDEIRLRDWQHDIRFANELLDEPTEIKSGAINLPRHVIATHLGVAVLLSADVANFSSCLLINPAWSGHGFLKEAQNHQSRISINHNRFLWQRYGEYPDEILGIRYSSAMIDDLSQLTALQVGETPPPNIRIYQSTPSSISATPPAWISEHCRNFSIKAIPASRPVAESTGAHPETGRSGFSDSAVQYLAHSIVRYLGRLS